LFGTHGHQQCILENAVATLPVSLVSLFTKVGLATH
jgi:hypothetical protein